jgi:hypothetical protein
MWHKVRLLQTSEWETLPKLREGSKFMKPKDEIYGIIEELLEDITEINNLIYAGATFYRSSESAQQNWQKQKK